MVDANDPNDAKADRRRAERVPINEEFGRLPGTNTWVSDLSEGGVFVHSRDRLAIGSTIQLRFTVLLRDPVVIEAVGTVVRHSEHPHGMGIAFAAVSDDMAARIQAVLEHRRPKDTGAPLRKLAMPLAPLPADDYAARSLTDEQFQRLTGLPVDDDDDDTPIDDDPTITLKRPVGDDDETQLLKKPAPASGSPRFAPPPRAPRRSSQDD